MNKISMQNISVMSVQYWHYSFDYFLDSMEKCGLHNIELWTGAPHYYLGHYDTPQEAKKQRQFLFKKIKDRGMSVIMITPEQLNYPINIAGRDPLYREKSIQYLKQYIDAACDFECSNVFTTSGWGLLDEPREEAWQRSVSSLKILSAYAHARGVNLIIEQLQPYESNLLTTCDDMVRMLNEVDSPALQCCVDLVAMAVVEDSLSDFFTKVGERIRHVHFADGNPSGHYICGDGNLPLQDYIHILEQNNYDGYLTLEINDAIYWDDPHRSIAQSAAYLRRILPENC